MVKPLLHCATDVSCNLSQNALRDTLHENIPKYLHLTTGSCDLSANEKFLEVVAESRTVFYFCQRFFQLGSQRFRPLQGMLHWAMFRATCLGMALREKLHEKLYSVTAPLDSVVLSDKGYKLEDPVSLYFLVSVICTVEECKLQGFYFHSQAV